MPQLYWNLNWTCHRLIGAVPTPTFPLARGLQAEDTLAGVSRPGSIDWDRDRLGSILLKARVYRPTVTVIDTDTLIVKDCLCLMDTSKT